MSVDLAAAGYTAAVDPMGAALHALRHDGTDLVVPARPDDPAGLFRGVVVAPWPNRVVGGRYRFRGTEHRLELTEPERGHALHGFSTDREWRVSTRSEGSAVLVLDLPPQPGYPWALVLRASYTLSAAGLRLDLVARNECGDPAPYGCAWHPYLTCGTARVDAAELTLPVRTRLEVDEVLAPTSSTRVEDVGSDFRVARPIGDLRLDHAFTDVTWAADETSSAELRGPDRGVRMTWGRWAPWLQVHTADRPEARVDRVGLALEPMSCPPGAFSSGEDLVVLGPGEEHHAWWALATVG